MSSTFIWMMTIGIVGLYCVYMVIMVVRRNKNKEKVWHQRIDSLSGVGKVEKKGSAQVAFIRENLEKGSKRKSKLSAKIVKITSLRHWLKYTGYDITPAKLYSAGLCIVLLFTVTFHILTNYNLALIVAVSIVLSAVICFMAVYLLISRQKTKFLDAFPDALDLIRRALRAGYAADRSIVMAAEESPEPVKSAFQSVIYRLSIGEPLDQALSDVANDVGVDEFHLLAIVLVLQRDTGGSLADVIENFANIMRERLRLRKKIKSITAEGKASGYLVSSIPFVIIIILTLISPNYLVPLFETEQGHNFLLFGGGMMGLGVFIIYRMVNKDYY